MFLSRLLLNPLNRTVERDLANRHDLHRTIMRAFPSSGDSEAARASLGVLFRLEFEELQGLPRVYVQSKSEPNWSLLPSEYLVEQAENPACRCLDAAYGRIKEGVVLAFTLVANPTRKVATSSKTERLAGEKSNGRRTFISDPQSQLVWLARRAEAGGFDLVSTGSESAPPDVMSVPGDQVYGRKGRKENTGQTELEFGAVTFNGRLRVTDRRRFLGALAQGFGSGKAYGFGLLSLAPASGYGRQGAE